MVVTAVCILSTKFDINVKSGEANFGANKNHDQDITNRYNYNDEIDHDNESSYIQPFYCVTRCT